MKLSIKKIFGSGVTTLVITNGEMNIVRKVKSLEESSLLIKGISNIIKIETKEQKRGFLKMLLTTFDASLSEDLLTGKGTVRAGEGKIRVVQNF